jgi:hypothetical protein
MPIAGSLALDGHGSIPIGHQVAFENEQESRKSLRRHCGPIQTGDTSFASWRQIVALCDDLMGFIASGKLFVSGRALSSSDRR